IVQRHRRSKSITTRALERQALLMAGRREVIASLPPQDYPQAIERPRQGSRRPLLTQDGHTLFIQGDGARILVALGGEYAQVTQRRRHPGPMAISPSQRQARLIVGGGAGIVALLVGENACGVERKRTDVARRGALVLTSVEGEQALQPV